MAVMTLVQAVVVFNAISAYGTISNIAFYRVAAILLTIPFWLISLLFPNQILSMILTGQYFSSIQIGKFRIFIFIVPILSLIFMAMTFFPTVNKGKPVAIIGMARQFIFMSLLY